MAERILIEDFEQEKAIELSDGTVLDIPQRTADLYEKITALENKRESKSEYDFIEEILVLLFGKDGFKRIAPKGKKTNLDYLTKVYLVSVELFMSGKTELEKEQLEKRAEMLEPITERLEALSPMLNKVK